MLRRRVRLRPLLPETEAAAEGEDELSQGGAAMALSLRMAGEGSRRIPGLFLLFCLQAKGGSLPGVPRARLSEMEEAILPPAVRGPGGGGGARRWPRAQPLSQTFWTDGSFSLGRAVPSLAQATQTAAVPPAWLQVIDRSGPVQSESREMTA